jgi:hypothetical protein
MKWKNIFLSASLVEFAIGFSDAQPNVFFYLGRPLGAIFFWLFLLCVFLEKEVALFDEQNRAAELEYAPAPARPAVEPRRPEPATRPGFATAHSH